VLTRPLRSAPTSSCTRRRSTFNGHSDVLAGALVTARADEFWQRIVAVALQSRRRARLVEAFLLLRGMRTLYLRVERACRSPSGSQRILPTTRASPACSTPACQPSRTRRRRAPDARRFAAC